jgi:hypothetical protein
MKQTLNAPRDIGIPIPDPIIWKPLEPKTAAEILRLYGSGAGAEPSLPVILAMLCYSGPAEGIISNWNEDQKESLVIWHRRFFTLPRVQRILRAIISGEAGDEVREILQKHLNKSCGSPVGARVFWVALSGWLKARILNCFENRAWKAFKKEQGFHDNAFIWNQIDLSELLELPLRDLHSEEEVENT